MGTPDRIRLMAVPDSSSRAGFGRLSWGIAGCPAVWRDDGLC